MKTESKRKSGLFAWILFLFTFLLFLAAGCGFDMNVKYKLSFESNGGTKCETVSSDDVATLKLPSDPEKENFIFEGWYWDDGVWEKPFTINSILDQPVSEYMKMTVYAKWKGVSVSLVLKNGETEEEKQIEYGAPYSLPVPVREEGDRFLGWSADPDGKNMLTDEKGKSLVPCDFLSVEAVPVWKQGKIVLTLHAGKGALNADMVYAFKGEPVGALPVPSLIGYKFSGWFTAETGGEAVGENSVFDGDLAIWARYEEIKYVRITYDGNGGSSEMTEQTAAEGEQITLRYSEFYRDGCTFVGWECNGVMYAPYDEVCFEPGEYVMKAVWEGVSYTVRFFAGDGEAEGEMKPQSFVCGTAQPLSANAFTRRGYKFLYWECDSKAYADGEIVEDLSTWEGDVVYMTAQWEPIRYTAIFKESEHAADGLRVDCVYDRAEELPDSGINKEGYHQTGWLQSGGDIYLSRRSKIYNLTEKDGAVLRFYPEFVINTYTLIFGSKEVTLEYGQEYELPEPQKQRTGYQFAGWMFSSWGLTEEYQTGVYPVGEKVKNVAAENEVEVDVYESWTPVSFTLRLYADDGSDATSEVQATYDESLNLPLDWLEERQNFKFIGFYFSVGGSNDILASYLDSSEIGILYERAEEGVASLHAIWKYKYKGSGTKEDPYLVENADGMENMAMAAFVDMTWHSTAVRTSFRFTADIDMSGRTFTPIGWYKNSDCYDCVVQGGGHVVSNLTIAPPAWYEKEDFSYVGFMNKAKNSSVSDLTFDGCSLSVNRSSEYYEAAIGFFFGESYCSSLTNVSVLNGVLNVTTKEVSLGGNGCYVGGLLGKNSYDYSDEFISGGFFRGRITVSAPVARVGGLAGRFGKITACAAIADIDVTATDGVVAGLATQFFGADSCYAILNATVKAENVVVYGTANTKSESVYSCGSSTVTLNGNAGKAEELNGVVSPEELKDSEWLAAHLPLMRTTRWTIKDGYPVPGSRELKTIEIATREEFLALSGKNLCERYVLKTDIDLNGSNWIPANVIGSFDGNGHTISGFKVNSPTERGAERLVGFFYDNYGTICNLVLKDISQMILTARSGATPTVYAGGIVAKNHGMIYACKTTGKIVVQAENCHVYVGGIAAWSEGTILSSYTECTLTGIANENVEYSTGGVISLGGYFDVCVNGIAYCAGGRISGCYTKGTYTANGSRYISVGGVSNAAEKSFSLADLNYRDVGPKQRAKIDYVYEVAKDLKGCASQKINDVVSVGGIYEEFLKSADYLTGTLGMRLYTSSENFAQDFEAAWVFVDGADGAFPKLYFEV